MHFDGYVSSMLRCAVIVVFLFIACSQSASLSDNRNVPLAIITSNSIELTPAKVGSVISADFLSQTTFAALSENVEKLVFVVLPKLSFPRLVYDANYNNKQDTQFLSQALGSMSSVIYPAVSQIDRVYEPFGRSMTILHVKSPNELQSQEILGGGRKIQIKLDGGISLHDADAILGSVINLLNTNVHSFAVVYTAEEPDEWISGIPTSHQQSAELSSVKDEVLARYKRQASKKTINKPKQAPRVSEPSSKLQDSNTTILIYGENCFLFYATNITLSIENSTSQDKPKARAELPNKFLKIDANCTSEGKKRDPFNFTVEYGAVGNFTKLSLTYSVKMRNAWEWHVHAITVDFSSDINGVREGPAVFEPGALLTAQVLFSFHCNVPEEVKCPKCAESGLKGSLKFGTVQVQAYDIKTGKDKDGKDLLWPKFGWQCDCVGFFTSAIWAGLVVSVIYLLIIALAMIMLMNLETMDRFEDPKGHGLKIQANG